MRIGINARGFRDATLRGINRYTYNLLKELQKQPDIELYFYTDSKSPIHDFFRSAIQATIVEIPASKVLIYNHVLLPLRLRQDRIDLFHAPGETGIPFFRVCPYVLTYHGVPELGLQHLVRTGELKGRLRDFFDGPERFSIRQTLASWRFSMFRKLTVVRANRVITVSNFSKRELTQFLSVPPEKMRVTYEAADDVFQRAAHGQSVPHIVDPSNHLPEKYLLFVGGFNRHKNVQGLLRLFARLKPRHPDLALVLVGSGGAWEACRALAVELGLEFQRDVFILQGIPDDELRTIYARATVFITLAWHEGFCLPVLEAMSCGAPVIASQFGAIPEIVGDSAMVVDPRRPDEMVECLEILLNDVSARRSLAARGRRRALSFSWQKTAEETIQIYRELCGRQRVGPDSECDHRDERAA